MAHFAHINIEGVVDCVLVISQETLDASGGWTVGGVFRPSSEWKQTSYNTVGGVHRLGGEPMRKNYAGVGYKYDEARDAFIPPQKFPSWTLDEEKCIYVAPVPRPTGLEENEIAKWNEDRLDWDVVHNVRCACGECGNDPAKMICPVYETVKQQ